MLKAYLTVEDGLIETPEIEQKGTWINLVNPTEAELEQVAARGGILADFLRAPLDEEERPRIEVDEGQVMVIINIPIVENDNGISRYDTIPLGIIVTNENIVTVCLRENSVINSFTSARVKSMFTFKKTRFVLQILLQTATLYLRYLREIDKRTSEIEKELQRSMKNEELIRLLNLEKSLVYFTTSLKSNGIVMEKILKSELLKMYPDDEDLLQDVITENRQAIEMGDIYTNILSGMMDAFASVISNNLNIVMKFLTSVTIVLSIPTMVASFFGMNVGLPFQGSSNAFAIILALSFLLSSAAVVVLFKKKMI